MTVKSRVYDTYWSKTPDFVTPTSNSFGKETRIDLTETTDSDGHPWFLSLQNGYQGYDIGGGFYTKKPYWKPQFDQTFSLNANYGDARWVNGTIHSATPNFTDLEKSVSEISNMTLDSWGTTAISGVIPTKSEMDLVVSGIELAREGLPALIGQGLLKSKLKDYRKAGDELLNYEFGIKPLIGDLKSLAKSIVNAQKRIEQLERDSGKLVRRNFRFPDREETFVTPVHWSGAAPSGWSNTYNWYDVTKNSRTVTSKYTTKRWFSGAFTYHLDIGARHRDQMVAAADNARLLLGVKLDAETVWNLAPWTWLADWFGNAGDIMTNVSHFSRDGLVMPYGYMMAETSADCTSYSRLYWRSPGGPEQVYDRYGFVRKYRRPANPYGFGLSDLALDARQMSILGALGITRMPSRV